MGRGRPVIRIRSREEQQRRKLLFLGVPLFAIGSALIWHFTTPEETTPDKPGIGQITQATPEQTLQQIEIPSSRQDEGSAPPAIPTPEGSNTSSKPAAQQAEDTTQQAAITPKTNETDVASTEQAPANTEATTETAQAVTTETNPQSVATTSEANATPKTPEPDATTAANEAKTAQVQPEKVATAQENKTEIAEEASSTEAAQQVTATEVQSEPVETQQAAAEEAKPKETQQATTEEPKPEETQQATTEEAKPEIADNGKRGWVYAGQFRNGNWIKRGLMIDNQLPQEGQQYKLAWGSTLRNSPPRKRTASGSNLGEQIGFLQQGLAVQVVTVKQSGRNGHIWLEVQQ